MQRHFIYVPLSNSIPAFTSSRCSPIHQSAIEGFFFTAPTYQFVRYFSELSPPSSFPPSFGTRHMRLYPSSASCQAHLWSGRDCSHAQDTCLSLHRNPCSRCCPLFISVPSTDSLVTLSKILSSNGSPFFQFGLAALTADASAAVYCFSYCCNDHVPFKRSSSLMLNWYARKTSEQFSLQQADCLPEQLWICPVWNTEHAAAYGEFHNGYRCRSPPAHRRNSPAATRSGRQSPDIHAVRVQYGDWKGYMEWEKFLGFLEN